MITADITSRSTAPAVLHRSAARPATTARPPGTVVHDPTLVLSALEELEAKRRDLEWLVEADFLWRCLP